MKGLGFRVMAWVSVHCFRTSVGSVQGSNSQLWSKNCVHIFWCKRLRFAQYCGMLHRTDRKPLNAEPQTLHPKI